MVWVVYLTRNRDGLTFIVPTDVTDQWVLAALAGRETYGTQVLWCRRSCMRLFVCLVRHPPAVMLLHSLVQQRLHIPLIVLSHCWLHRLKRAHASWGIRRHAPWVMSASEVQLTVIQTFQMAGVSSFS